MIFFHIVCETRYFNERQKAILFAPGKEATFKHNMKKGDYEEKQI